jgi:hypothetical protein
MHIADINFAEFYAPAFLSRENAAQFVKTVESLSGPAPAKIALHQGARMIWLADRMQEVARGRAALQILFCLIAAEAVAKIVFGFKGEGKSRQHVHLFFRQICSNEHRRALAEAFSFVTGGFLTREDAVNKLYDVRCDVVHEGRYFYFDLRDAGRDGEAPVIADVADRELIAHLSSAQLRQIVLEGVVEGVKKLLPPASLHDATRVGSALGCNAEGL